MSSSRGYGGGLALVLALLCLGLFAPTAGAVEFPYTLDPALSLTGDCSTTPGVDEVKDPDCEPTYPPPPAGPSGRFDLPFSLTVDDWGNLYVASRSGDGTEGRIDIFDSEGHFISELDDPFGPQSIAVDGEGNLYAFEALLGVPGAPPPSVVRYPPATYNPAAEEIEYDPGDRTTIAAFPEISFIYNGLAIDRANSLDPGDDRLIINEEFQIQIYSSAKAGNTLEATLTPAGMGWGKQVAVDAERRLLYVTTCKEGSQKCVVWVFSADAPYNFVAEISGATTPAGKFFSKQGRISIAVDETNGHLFVGDLEIKLDVYELDEDYGFVSSFQIPSSVLGTEVQSDVAENPKAPDPEDLNEKDNYRHLYVPLSQSSGSALAFAPPAIGPPVIESASAANIGESEAELRALIHPHQLETTYSFEYVSEAQWEIDEFESATLAKSGTIAGLPSAQQVSTVITGLDPGSAYRFRVFAENEAGEDEAKAAFTTYADADPNPEPGSCPNEALRAGPSATLPDCRAYELATPPNSGGAGAGFEGQRFGMVQSSASGGAVSFEILSGSLPGTEAAGAFHGDAYLATRGAGGWSTALAGPTATQSNRPIPGSFSPDQGHSFWTAAGEGSAVIGAKQTNYVRYPDESSELIGRGSIDTDPRALGKLITEDGTHIVFETTTGKGDQAQKLEPNAPEEGISAVYDRTADEVTHVVSLLPGDITPSQPATYAGASADGEGIAFEIGTSLYLRVNNETTHAIGSGLTFAGVSEGGERIFYVEAGDLKAFDTTTEEEIDFSGATISSATPVNVAPQGTRAYFVSETALGGPNPNGDSPVATEPNLYLSENGTIAFVATLTDRDVSGIKIEGTGAQGDGLGLWTLSLEERTPAIAPSRLTPEGSVFVFQSRADLTGYDSGEDPQVYRYDHAAARLHCVSCPPTKAPASGGAVLQSISALDIFAPLSRFGFVPALRADGARLFFESREALVSTDVDGLRDVYEWEEENVGSCKQAGGCVYLISSGQSARADYLFGHSQSGDDVFFSSRDSLVPGSGEVGGVYDARVGGGFAQPANPICAHLEECHPAPNSPPGLPAPESGVYAPGDPAPPKKPKKCPRGKRKVKLKSGKVVCVKKHKKQRKAASNRGASK